MIDKIKELIKTYKPISYGRLASCRPEILIFLKEWNKNRKCKTLTEQFFCINYNIEPPKCECGQKLLFNTFVLGYRYTCGSKKCKAESQAKSLSEFWINNPDIKAEMIKNRENTCLELYAAKSAMQSPEFLAQLREKLLRETGYAFPFENPLVVEKAKKTCQENNKVDFPFQSKVIQDRAIKSYEDNHGHKNNMIEARTAHLENLKKTSDIKEQEVIKNRIQTRRHLSSSYQKNINEVKAYTYLLKFKLTGQVYYGARSKNIALNLTPLQDFMINYTTSSKQINNLIKNYGISAFEYEIRRTFNTPEQAYYWEQTVLRRLKVVSNPVWLNQNAGGYIVPTEDGLKRISEANSKPKSAEHRRNMSISATGKIRTKEHCDNLSKSQKGRKYPERQGINNKSYDTVWMNRDKKQSK